MGLPSPALTVIISLSDPLELCGMPRPGRSPGRFDALVGGLHDAPAMIRHDGNQFGFHLRLTPAGARALLGVPPGAVAGEVVALDDLLGPLAAELVDRVRAAPTWADRLASLSAVLARALPDRQASAAPEISAAWDLLVASRGQARVAEVAREVGWSRRHLTGRFGAEIGLSPKAVARIVRFDRAQRLLTAAPRRGIAAVAAACGYADQAHLTRDWHRLAGRSPRRWLAEEVFPFVQDLEGAEASGLPA